MMSKKCQHRSVFIAILNLIVVVNTDDVRYGTTHRNKCLLSDMRMSFFVKISLKQCVQECAVRLICQSVNYKRKYLHCELYSVDDGAFVESGTCVFIRKTSFDPQIPTSCSCDTDETCDGSYSCVITECPTLELSKGVVHGNLNTLGSKVKYACNNNYLESNNKTHSTCEQSGMWSYIPRCVNGCAVLTLDHGAIAESLTAFGSMIHYSCDENYIESENKTNTTCQYTGEWSYMPHCVTDGDRNPYFEKCSHTRGVKDYVVIDLGESYTKHALYIVNRQDCCMERLRNVSISIGDSMENMKLHVYHKDPIGATCTFVLVQPCRGRYMKIVNVATQVLAICELEVYGN